MLVDDDITLSEHIEEFSHRLIFFFSSRFFVTIICFLEIKVPAVQITLESLGIVSGKKMLSAWKYVIVVCTFIEAIITPSTDPFT